MSDRQAAGVAAALRGSRGLFISVGLFSGVINVLALTGAIYMLQVYDRVLLSRSVPTLVALSILMVALFSASGVLDLVRTRIMARIGLRVDEALRERVFDCLQKASLRGRSGDGLQPVRDLDRVRNFLSGIGPAALFDLPWIPVYITMIFLLHPLMGWFAVAGALLLVAITLLTELLSKGPAIEAVRSASLRLALAGAADRNAEVVRAMGLSPHLQKRWRAFSDIHLGDQLKASDAAGGMGVMSKIIRLLMQSGMLGLGAYLVLQDQVSAGAIIAGSIVMSRALAPIEIAIQHWRGFVESRQASHRLRELFAEVGDGGRQVTALPAPRRTLAVESLSVAPPGQTKPVISNVSFGLKAGEAIGIIGPSGSGKSTLARALVGVWRPESGAGAVRLDGATLDQWQPDDLGRHVGYLPQDIQLFEGTVAQNIARLDEAAADAGIVAAAQEAGAHDMIVSLPDGYQTRLGANGAGLSAGQRQRIALARALYGKPFLVVLDEPNSNLDSAGDAALSDAIRAIRERGGIAVVIAHRPAALANIDKVMAMAGGRVQALGAKEDVLRKVLAAVPSAVVAPAAAGRTGTDRDGPA
jgi:ATP-binding cassette subfamily C protein